MEENDIRPKNLLEKQKIAVLADIRKLLSRKNEFVRINCPACNSDNVTKEFEKNGFEYSRCFGCETLFMNPRPNLETLKWFYKYSENYQYWNKYIFPASAKARKKEIIIPLVNEVLKLVYKYNPEAKSLVEIGAGFGIFCEEIKSRNKFKRIIGIEPVPNLAETCRDKGIEIIEKPIEELREEELKGEFDFVVNFEVIEHLFSPKDFLIKCKSILNPNGILVFTCPNNRGFDFITLGKLCNSIDHEHLNYFNTESIRILLESCGFEVLEIKTPGKLDAELVRNKILSHEFDISENKFFKKILIDEWESAGRNFQKFISDNMLSSSMLVIARKMYIQKQENIKTLKDMRLGGKE